MIRNIKNKPWYAEAMSLDEYIERLQAIKAKHPPGTIFKVIGIKDDEESLFTVHTRSELLDQELGKYFNGLGHHLTDIEIEDSAEEVTHQIASEGEVVYLVLSPGLSPAPPNLFEE